MRLPPFPVTPSKEQALKHRMQSLGIREEDIEEKFVKSSGNGGQNLNKTSTAVRLLHKPSGISVHCSVSRSQGLNRYKARVLLCDQLEDKILGRESQIQKKIAKIRKAKKEKKRKQLKKSFTDIKQ